MSEPTLLSEIIRKSALVTDVKDLTLLTADSNDGTINRFSPLSLRCYALFGIAAVHTVSRTQTYPLATVKGWLSIPTAWWSEVFSSVPAGDIVVFSAVIEETGARFRFFYIAIDELDPEWSRRLLRPLALEIDGYPLMWATPPGV